MRRFHTLKPMAGLYKGSIFNEKKNGYTHDLTAVTYVGFPKEVVENNPEWFAEIKECKHQVFCHICHMEVDLNG